MIIDNHVHVGWFTDGYHSPKEVWNSAIAAGINGMVVSSTSTCAELYKDVRRELRELKRLGGDRVHPVLWLTPRMLKVKYALPYMLHSKIKWQGVKIHSEAHPEWAHNKALLDKALNVARNLDVPILVHTGNFSSCHAGLFKDVIAENSDLTFVLAHGRPINETIEILQCCHNVYVDTAFMPKEDLYQLAELGLSDKILFGTDVPINTVFFKYISTSDYIRLRTQELHDVLGDEAEKVFNRCIYRSI